MTPIAAPSGRDAVYFPGLVPVPFANVAGILTGSPRARELLDIAEAALGYSLLERGPTADIFDWEVFEATHVILGLTLAHDLERTHGARPVACGGQSFGAITAAMYAETITVFDGMRLIAESTRVERDYFAGLPRPVGTLFFYRLTAERVAQLIAASGRDLEISVYLDNLVHGVCGTDDDLDAFTPAVRAAGGHVFYRMNRAEHCSSLAGLQRRLADEVYRRFVWFDPRLPMISDVDGAILRTGDAVADDLTAGWVTPVRWSLVADALVETGAERIFVVGPSSMFTRLVNRRVPTVEVSPRTVARGLVAGGAR